MKYLQPPAKKAVMQEQRRHVAVVESLHSYTSLFRMYRALETTLNHLSFTLVVRSRGSSTTTGDTAGVVCGRSTVTARPAARALFCSVETKAKGLDRGCGSVLCADCTRDKATAFCKTEVRDKGSSGGREEGNSGCGLVPTSRSS
mmetsp:Transcript_6000/g.9215  ORF Transcript_6000/g.9215 Transcript_6000/m.9215 type:complete len:145 (+) Transcript_6000:135-569(+)